MPRGADKREAMLQRLARYKELRESSLSIADAAEEIGIPYSTAERYERWLRTAQGVTEPRRRSPGMKLERFL